MFKKSSYDYDLIIIGSGSAGSVAASLVAKSGKKVALIESDIFGGDSPNFGDVPLQALLNVAHLYDNVKNGSQFGLRTGTLGYNFHGLMDWKKLVVSRTGATDNRHYYDSQGIRTYHGEARFISPDTITINRQHLRAKFFLVATGSSWSIPNIPGLDHVNFCTEKTIFDLAKPPKSLLIIGGGKTGVEIAELFSIFDTKIYLVEIASRLLPRYDEDVGDLIENNLKKHPNVTVLNQTRILQVQKDGLGKKIIINKAGAEKTIHVDDVLIATGKNPNVDLGLDNAGVTFTPQGIETDDFLQTSNKHIFAAGQVLAKENNQTYTALLESRIVAYNILHNSKKVKPDYEGIPNIVYTNPVIAQVGLSEDDCMKRDLKVKVAKVPLNLLTASNIFNFSDGFVKLIATKDHTILGATIISPWANEMVQELALAIKCGLTTDDIVDTHYSLLSYSEAIHLAALKINQA